MFLQITLVVFLLGVDPANSSKLWSTPCVQTLDCIHSSDGSKSFSRFHCLHWYGKEHTLSSFLCTYETISFFKDFIYMRECLQESRGKGQRETEKHSGLSKESNSSSIPGPRDRDLSHPGHPLGKHFFGIFSFFVLFVNTEDTQMSSAKLQSPWCVHYNRRPRSGVLGSTASKQKSGDQIQCVQKTQHLTMSCFNAEEYRWVPWREVFHFRKCKIASQKKV